VTRPSVSVVLSATAATTSHDIVAFARHAEQAGTGGDLHGTAAWDAVGIPLLNEAGPPMPRWKFCPT
jgi:hypothetical protein